MPASSIELRTDDGFLMVVPTDAPAGPLRVCIAVPAARRDPGACAELPLDGMRPTPASLVAYVCGGSDTFAVSVLRMPGRYEVLKSAQSARDFAKGYFEHAGQDLKPPMAVAALPPDATLVQAGGGANAASFAYDVSGIDPAGPMRIGAHQRVYAMVADDAVHLVVWTSSAATAQEVDDLAARTAPTMQVAKAPHRDVFHMPVDVLLAVVPLIVVAGIVSVVVRARVRRR